MSCPYLILPASDHALLNVTFRCGGWLVIKFLGGDWRMMLLWQILVQEHTEKGPSAFQAKSLVRHDHLPDEVGADMALEGAALVRAGIRAHARGGVRVVIFGLLLERTL
jgi:hypothetical protein